jgi:hypothetical protein
MRNFLSKRRGGKVNCFVRFISTKKKAFCKKKKTWFEGNGVGWPLFTDLLFRAVEKALSKNSQQLPGHF